MSYELPEPKLGHPDSAIRLASAVHRFRVPAMTKTVSFERSFKTVGKDPRTRSVLLKADANRKQLHEALDARTISGERVCNEAARYLPNIHQILLSCKFQPEVARLDQRLVFEWKSGVEKDPVAFSSEALMYDMVMCCVCEGLGRAATATESSVAGEFAAASRQYAVAAGVFEFLAQDHLPKWIAKGSNVNPENLPSEASIGASKAFVELLLANGQQMAVATVLIKPGTPNYSLLAKLCLGILERLESFYSIMRKEAAQQIERFDKNFFTLLTFQQGIQKSLSKYFHSRALWDSQDFGLAIALLDEAKVALNGISDFDKKSPLKPLQKDLTDLKAHMTLLLKHWEQDNSSVYFENVPKKFPEEKRLAAPLQLTKVTSYTLEDVEPLALIMPDGGMKRSDSDLARQLQESLNAGFDG